jgi:diacylglycerol kinase family enzyme
VRPAASTVVLVNGRAGVTLGGGDLRRNLERLFQDAGCAVEIRTLNDGEDPAEAAREARARAAVVVAAGGDGTVSAVASGLAGSDAALGILPMGTLNHFAKDLRIPLDVAAAVAVIAAGHVAIVDVGQVNERVFVNNSSIGIYPSIVDAREQLRREGHAKWPAMILATLRILRRYRGVRVTIEAGGRRHTRRTPFVFVGNNEYTIDGPRLGRRIRVDGGTLFVYLAPRLRARDLPLLLVKAAFGRARAAGGFEIVPATELWIGLSRTRRLRVAYDGEVAYMQTPLHYRVRPGALRVVVPRA